MALIDIGLQQQLFDGRSSSGRAKVWSSMHTPPQLVDGLPGCGLDAADPLVGDELGRMVTWRGSGDLSALAGREVSVRLHLKRAQVFCLSL